MTGPILVGSVITIDIPHDRIAATARALGLKPPVFRFGGNWVLR